MKKRDLKNRITEAFESEKPDLRAKILASCEKEEQLPATAPAAQVIETPMRRPNYNMIFKRMAACAICLMLFISGLSIGLFIPNGDGGTVTPTDAETFVYLDVNPSIELRMDNKNKILECLAANEDAETILAVLKLEGADMNTALTAIVGSMYANGYLTEDSNSILISVDGKDEKTADTLLSDITSKINTVFENSGLECSIIAQRVEVDDELKQRAQENGVSVGKMHLVDKMVGGMDDFDAEDAPELADMSIKDLNLIYSTRPNKGGENDPFGKDISSGDIGGVVKQDDALTLLLVAIDIDRTEVEWYRVQAKPQNRQMVYNVSIRIKGDATTYEFEVDCQTGEVVKIDTNMPNINPPGRNGGAPQSETLPDEHEPNNQNTGAPSSGDGVQNAPSPDENEGEPQQGRKQSNDTTINRGQSKDDSNTFRKMPQSNVRDTPNQP